MAMLFSIFLFFQVVFMTVNARIMPLRSKPEYWLDDTVFNMVEQVHARHARQLVAENDWATLSTISKIYGGAPYGNIVSYSDGLANDKQSSTGVLYFYLTPLDSAGMDLKHNSTASVSISMVQKPSETCKVMDVEDPTCWKATLVGHVIPIEDADEHKLAQDALFSKHPQMEYWPKNHNFSFYKLELDEVVLLDFYGGAKRISSDQYYAVDLAKEKVF